MSIASSTRAAVARQRHHQPAAPPADQTLRRASRPEPPAGPPASTLETIAREIPSEAVAVYIAGLAFLAESSTTVRWIWVGIVLVGALLYANGVSLSEARRRGETHAVAPAQLALIACAFVLYACVIPASPLSSASWYTTTVAGLIALIGGFALAIVAIYRDAGAAPKPKG